MRQITTEQLEELEDWLKKFTLPRKHKKISRDFADCVLLAKILKIHYPNLVEIHNYSSASCVTIKYNNWETLNRKVLRKLGLQQTNDTLKNLAEGQPGAAEELLWLVMKKINSNQKPAASPTNQEPKDNDDVFVVNVTKQMGDALVQIPQKMILYSLYEMARNEIAEKDEIIMSLNQKVKTLEKIVNIRSQRIRSLYAQVKNQDHADTRIESYD